MVVSRVYMTLYKQEFGEGYPLGIRIPDYFKDQSYRNDTGPSFVYVQGDKLLKVCILPEDPQEREIEDSQRYALMEMKTAPGDDYQEFVGILFESESPEAFEKVVLDRSQLNQWLSD